MMSQDLYICLGETSMHAYTVITDNTLVFYKWNCRFIGIIALYVDFFLPITNLLDTNWLYI